MQEWRGKNIYKVITIKSEIRTLLKLLEYIIRNVNLLYIIKVTCLQLKMNYHVVYFSITTPVILVFLDSTVKPSTICSV